MRQGHRLARAAVGGFLLVLAACAGGDEDADSGLSSSEAPSVAPPAPGDFELSLVHDGTTREYLLHAPPTYDSATAMPLVVALHGRPSSPIALRNSTGLATKADDAQFIVVFPKGVGGQWNITGGDAGADDVGFISALIDEIESTWGTDPDRVYVTGFSNGAAMTYRLAAELSGTLAAVAPISGALDAADAVPGSPLPLVTITGSGDTRAENAVSEVLGGWRSRMGCGEMVQEQRDIGGGLVTVLSADCEAGAEIVWHSVDGMGHEWPTGEFGAWAPISANDIIWEFFEAHPGG